MHVLCVTFYDVCIHHTCMCCVLLFMIQHVWCMCCVLLLMYVCLSMYVYMYVCSVCMSDNTYGVCVVGYFLCVVCYFFMMYYVMYVNLYYVMYVNTFFMMCICFLLFYDARMFFTFL